VDKQDEAHHQSHLHKDEAQDLADWEIELVALHTLVLEPSAWEAREEQQQLEHTVLIRNSPVWVEWQWFDQHRP
jgi:hypothetical protein